MGCYEVKQSRPILIFTFEPQNKSQKEYCIKLKDNLKPKKSIHYEIKSFLKASFMIQLKVKGQLYTIEDNFDEGKMENSIKYINQLLGDEV